MNKKSTGCSKWTILFVLVVDVSVSIVAIVKPIATKIVKGEQTISFSFSLFNISKKMSADYASSGYLY